MHETRVFSVACGLGFSMVNGQIVVMSLVGDMLHQVNGQIVVMSLIGAMLHQVNGQIVVMSLIGAMLHQAKLCDRSF